MATYLLAWNPKHWTWTDQADAREAASNGGYSIPWACATKQVRPGDRVFLIKLGAEPRGIIGAGKATAAADEGPHYNPDRAAQGHVRRFIPVTFDTLLDPDELILDFRALSLGPLARMHWSIQRSGVRIPDDVAVALERAWAARLRRRPAESLAREMAAEEGHRKEATYYRRGRNRALRDRALADAHGICQTCGTDYSRVLGGKGVRVLQVHHKRQLALRDTPQLTRVSDLAVVCANCHVLIHADPKRALKVEALRAKLRR